MAGEYSTLTVLVGFYDYFLGVCCFLFVGLIILTHTRSDLICQEPSVSMVQNDSYAFLHMKYSISHDKWLCCTFYTAIPRILWWVTQCHQFWYVSGGFYSERTSETIPSARGSDRSSALTVQLPGLPGSGSLSCHKPVGMSRLSNSRMCVNVSEENLPNGLSFTAKPYLYLADSLPTRTLSWWS